MQLSSEIITASANAVHDGGAHLFWSGRIDETLMDSIREFGQTTPVLAQETDSGLKLISGHARLAILRDLGTPILVRLVLDASPVDKGLLYMTDNASRAMDDGMRLAALKYFAPLLERKELQATILPRLNVKPKSKDAKLLMAWLELPENWQNHLSAGHVPLAAGAVIARMSDDDMTAVEPLFANFSWSRSNAVNMLNWLFETSKMMAAPMAEVIRIHGMERLLHQGLSPKDTIARLTTLAKAARYPELTALNDSFAEAARELTVGTNWRVSQTNNFETGGAEIAVQIKTPEQLKKAMQDLETMASLTPWETIWNLGGRND